MNNIFKTPSSEPEHGDSPRFRIQQALIDDSKDESLAMGTILHRCNYLYTLVNQRNREPNNKTQAYASFSISISRECKYILTLVEDFYVSKTKHFEHQHSIMSHLIKDLKKYR